MKAMVTLFMLLTFLLVACSPPADNDTFPTTPPGITALVRQQSQDFDWEITDITDNILTAETYWNGERIIRRKLYRGLYPIYGMEFGRSFEVDFNYKVLDQLFPLKIGNEIAFEGTMNLIEDDYQVVTLVHMQVIDKGVQQIGEKSYPVYIIETTSQFSSGDNSDIIHHTLYYSFDLGVILKSITKGSGAQSYWRIRSIDVPENAKPKARRSSKTGTVRI